MMCIPVKAALVEARTIRIVSGEDALGDQFAGPDNIDVFLDDGRRRGLAFPPVRTGDSGRRGYISAVEVGDVVSAHDHPGQDSVNAGTGRVDKGASNSSARAFQVLPIESRKSGASTAVRTEAGLLAGKPRLGHGLEEAGDRHR